MDYSPELGGDPSVHWDAVLREEPTGKESKGAADPRRDVRGGGLRSTGA